MIPSHYSLSKKCYDNDMITIIDCGIGNLRSVQRAIEHLGFTCKITTSYTDVENASMLVLPGQGAFAEMKNNLNKLGLTDLVKDHIQAELPFLGICVGFQILFERSFENGTHLGLGIFPGDITPLNKKKVTVPHMGWNQLNIVKDPQKLFDENTSPNMYFANSFVLKNTASQIISATTPYDGEFISMVQAPNLLATQFHPEKSGEHGLELLRKFLITQQR